MPLDFLSRRQTDINQQKKNCSKKQKIKTLGSEKCAAAAKSYQSSGLLAELLLSKKTEISNSRLLREASDCEKEGAVASPSEGWNRGSWEAACGGSLGDGETWSSVRKWKEGGCLAERQIGFRKIKRLQDSEKKIKTKELNFKRRC